MKHEDLFKPLTIHVKSKKYFPTVLLYGALGTGKTAFLAQAGEGAIYMDFDRGIKTADTFEDKYTEDRHKILVADFFDDDPTTAVKYTLANDYISDLARACKKDPKKAPTYLILDSFTGFLKSCMMQTKMLQGKLDTPTNIQQWGLMFSEAERFMDKFKSIPCPKFVGGHDMIITLDENTKTPFSCPGKTFPTAIAGLMDDVFYTKIKGSGPKRKFIITAKGSAAVSCRTRTNAFLEWNMDDGFKEFCKALGYATMTPSVGGSK